MFTIAFIIIVPLFLYCSYLFGKDIKSSYSMYKFKRNRLKVDNSKVWKPVSLDELKITANHTVTPVITESTSHNIGNHQASLTELNTEKDEKPVIKLYKDVFSEIDKSEVLNNCFHDENLLLKIVKEMSIYDASARDLLTTYQNKIECYITQLISVVLVSSDKSTFFYPVEKTNETTILCYRISEAGVSEELIDITEIANFTITHNNYTDDLRELIDQYISMQRNIKGSLKKLQNNIILKVPESTSNYSAKFAGALL